jgi:hypothetical protein
MLRVAVLTARIDNMWASEHDENMKRVEDILEVQIFGDNNYDLDTLLVVASKKEILINSLNYWIFHNNPFRYYYDMKSFLLWIKEKNENP